MTTSDADFLADVDHFLASCNLPVFAEHAPTESVIDGKMAELPTPLLTRAMTDAASRIATNDSTPIKSLSRSAKHDIERAKDRKRRGAYRERRRAERHALRQQVDALSATLDEVLKAKTFNHNQMSPAWKTIAIHQYEARRAAEGEQQQLVAAIQSRSRLIQEFGQYMNEQFKGGEFAQVQSRDDEVNCRHKRIRLESSDTKVFESFLQELAAVYVQTNEVFKGCKMDSSPDGLIIPELTWKMDGDIGYYEFADKLVLPLDFRQTSELLWKVSQILHRQEDREIYDGVEDPENSKALKFRITRRLESGEVASAVQRMVCRRYEEDERLVVTWRSFTEGEGVFHGMHSDETGWCVALRSTTPSQSGTLLQVYTRTFPLHFSGAEKDEATVEQFAGLICTSGSEDIVEITSTLQAMHIEEEYM